jgi:hypothetical protein
MERSVSAGFPLSLTAHFCQGQLKVARGRLVFGTQF